MTKKKPAVRAALYARVSTGSQDVEMQLQELRLLANQRGWTVTEHVDEGVSGSTESRPALDQMMRDARAGKVKVVVVWKLDRLGRSLKHLLGILDELASIGVEFVSQRDSGIDTTSPTGRLLLQLLGAFAEFEREMIKERVQAGVDRAKAQGIHCGRPRVEMDLRAAHELLGLGHSQRAVADMLGVPRSTLRRRLQEGGPEVPL